MKKLISTLLAVVMLLALMPCAMATDVQSAADKFTDVPSDAWYLKELDYAVYNGYISGTSATTFSPDANITRGQFVTILGRMLGAPTSSGKTKFTDVKADSWYAPYVAWAAEKGYVNGTSATTFTPEANITVEQMATILANYISKTGVQLSGYTPSEAYKDASSTSGWAVANVELMRQYGLLHTDASGNVSPRKNVSRAEGAFTLVLMAKATGLGVDPNANSGGGSELEPAKSLEDLWKEIDEYADECNLMVQTIHDDLWRDGEITANSSEKDKAVAYFKWMCINCNYGDGEAFGFPKYQSHDAYGALINKRAVCEGLSLGYLALLQYEGITCETYQPNPSHMANKVTLDGVVYAVDVTHGVSSKNLDGTFNEFLFERYRDKYFYPERFNQDLPPLEW